MSRTVSPPDVRSLVSRWKTFIAGILAEVEAASTAERDVSRESAEGSRSRREPSEWRLVALEGDRERAGARDAARHGLLGGARLHRDGIERELGERQTVCRRVREVHGAEVRKWQ